MSSWKSASLLALTLPIAGFTACAGNWTGVTNMLWSTAGNWAPCIPNGAGDSATFGTTAFPSVNVDIPVTLQDLIFSSMATSYTLFGANTITFSGAATSVSVIGTQTIGNGVSSSNLIKLTNTMMSINTGASASNSLTVSNAGITDAIGSTSNINITGSGQIHVTNSLFINATTVPGSQIVPNGNLTMTNGSLFVTNNGTIGNAAMVATGAAFGANGNVTFTGVTVTGLNNGVVGSGALTENEGVVIGVQSGGGTLTLTNSDITLTNKAPVNIGKGITLQSGPTSGTINMNGGTLTVNNSSALTALGPVASGMIGAAVIAGSVPMPGDFNLNGGTVNLINNAAVGGNNFPLGVFGAALIANNFTIAGGGKTYVIENGSVGQPPGTIDNAGAGIKSSTSINVNDGLFVNDGIVGTPLLTIQPSGTFSGVGLFVGLPPLTAPVQVNNSGIAFPGDPGLGGTPVLGTTAPGQMTIIGNYTQTATGTLDINILNTGSFSQLNVEDTVPSTGAGTANLTGTVGVAVLPGFTLNPTDSFVIVKAPGGVTGTFPNIQNFNLPPGFDPIITPFPTFVLLSFKTSITQTIPSFPGNAPGVIVSNVNQLNQINQINRLRRFACGPTSIVKAESAMEKTAGKPDVPSWIKERAETIEPTPQQNLCNPQSACELNTWNVYAGPLGVLGGEFHTKADAVGFDYSAAGGLVGFDYVATHFGVGLAVAYEKIFADVHQNWGHFDIDDLHVSIYGKYSPIPKLAFNGILGGGYEFYDVDRKMRFSNLKENAKGTPHGTEFDALVGLEYAFANLQGMPERFQIIPEASVQYIQAEVAQYREHRAGLYNLRFKHQQLKSLRTNLGLRANYTVIGEKVAFTPEVVVDWQREFQYKERSLHFTTVAVVEPERSFTMPASGRNLVLAGANLFWNICNKYGVEATYNFQWNSLFHDHFVYVGFSIRP